MSQDFYDRSGTPIAYTEDGVHVFTFSGQPVGYFHDESLYSYVGKHLGRIANGLIRDNRGQVVFFSSDAVGGPMKPMRQLTPLKGLKRLMPLKSMRQLPPMRPMLANSWSQLSGQQLFF
ncbi:4-fold beta flower protein [Pseudomonas fluorescens]|uniref:4-fold beta flower domain-containing protein n=1 Tax=Pseudomonas fluorescens TaxID=294 RepID=A0A4Y9TFS5_PSEFL|nr:hypothetical protein [Pseudomonas fluorescens]MBD8239493.1 hypothetical protein [Pseudomonas fluorescens]MDY0898461.1 hypothetical protein [Pseudomonas fluorescens]TFW43154.1 hypothetical protein E4T65_12375 [Pseudomonas fluorescens]